MYGLRMAHYKGAASGGRHHSEKVSHSMFQKETVQAGKGASLGNMRMLLVGLLLAGLQTVIRLNLINVSDPNKLDTTYIKTSVVRMKCQVVHHRYSRPIADIDGTRNVVSFTPVRSRKVVLGRSKLPLQPLPRVFDVSRFANRTSIR